MSVIDVIAAAASRRQTVMLTAREKDGSVETREVEPYSLRQRSTGQLFYGWSVPDQGTRSWRVSNLIEAVSTGNAFTPRFPVEF